VTFRSRSTFNRRVATKYFTRRSGNPIPGVWPWREPHGME
jgi:hypothetical protein